jgi:hypothetical protein
LICFHPDFLILMLGVPLRICGYLPRHATADFDWFLANTRARVTAGRVSQAIRNRRGPTFLQEEAPTIGFIRGY